MRTGSLRQLLVFITRENASLAPLSRLIFYYYSDDDNDDDDDDDDDEREGRTINNIFNRLE